MKLKIGILFGGSSREREVSFAGGRTVYDNLDKNIFEAVPIFIDNFGNFILLHWEFIYKGSIRDFYPPVEWLPTSPHQFQIYAESLGEISPNEQLKLIRNIGTRIEPQALTELIDFAFLCLHGTDGEDGRIQGLLEFYRIPYSGSGILPSAIGMNKALQRKLMLAGGFAAPRYEVISRDEWFAAKDKSKIAERVFKTAGPSIVIKPANQGSSLGVSVLHNPGLQTFEKAVSLAFFSVTLLRSEWNQLTYEKQIARVRQLCDLREGIGMPVRIENKIIAHPEELFSVLRQLFSEQEEAVTIEACDGETEVLAESFIDGKEFSCIVIENENGEPIALPPTEIIKAGTFYDYRSKYLPGQSRKITPINLPSGQIEEIRIECEKLFRYFRFKVYARIDGFITPSGQILLNDPNTTSGMMPSSFFFHQAAEIGLNPSQFLTYIIRASMAARIQDFKNYRHLPYLLEKSDHAIAEAKRENKQKTRVAVILGGYSSERHISVESGRNIYEKLSSSEKYHPVPVFLHGNENHYSLYIIPVNMLLKDNADDIREKVDHFKQHEVVTGIISQCKQITEKFGSASQLEAPRKITFSELAQLADFAFIALHGRPGEDGQIQRELQAVNIPFNGSGYETSQITIDKYRTNELLMQHGFLAAQHTLVTEEEWRNDPSATEERILKKFSLPFVAKPVDDGCSSAVKIIRTENEFHAYAEMMFRKTDSFPEQPLQLLRIKTGEEFPRKTQFLVEELITKGEALHFLEVTGGMLTGYDESGNLTYEIFEPSETLAGGDVLSLEEKFLAGEGQNITPARFSYNSRLNTLVSNRVKEQLEKAARLLRIEGYARIDAFVRIYKDERVEVIFIEVNSLPGMTPATCIFHQAALSHYKPFDFIDRIITYGLQRYHPSGQKSKL
jgi:D-alanine-D-alanine ligase